MTTATSPDRPSLSETPPGAECPIYGSAPTGGIYNSHVVAGVIFAGLAAAGAINVWLAAWLIGCTAIGLFIDHRPWNRKLVVTAIPGQMFLYVQVLFRAATHLLPYYLVAFVLYVCMAPFLLPLNLAISSFVMLYGFHMIVRSYWLVRYLWVLHFRWGNAGRMFATHKANLKSPTSASRHVVWSFFIGNVGLVVRCASQVITIGGFELLRQSLALDLTKHPTLSHHLTTILIVAVVIWLVTFWFAVQPALLIYYRAHRTFHTCRPLYDGIHSIHHVGVLPTQLDSGTISPLEFFITEMGVPAATLVPNWWWTFAQIVLGFAGHFPAHQTNTGIKSAHHHLLHHRTLNYNFGLIPREDDRYGTRYPESEETTSETSAAGIPATP